MSLNDFEPPKNLTFDYVLNFQPSDFFSYGMDNSYDAKCKKFKGLETSKTPCNLDNESQDCYIQTLCENRELANETMNIARSNQEAKKRLKESSDIYENAVQNCVTLCVGIAAMVIVGIKSF